MKFPKGLRPSKIAGKDRWRETLTGALIRCEGEGDKERMVVYVTDSYCFLRAEVLTYNGDDHEGPIPLPALKHIERGVETQLGKGTITAGITHYDRVLYEGDRKDFGYGPDLEEGKCRLPQDRYHDLKPSKPKRPFRLGLTPEILKNLSDAMGVGHGAIAVEFDLDAAQKLRHTREEVLTYLKPLKVVSLSNETREGILMPVRVGEVEPLEKPKPLKAPRRKKK